MSNRNKIIYGGRTFEGSRIKDGSIHLATSLLSSQLEANSFTATVKSDDATLTSFERDAPLVYFYREAQVGIFYVQDISRVGPNLYSISATSAIGLLIEGLHYGGIYTGQTVDEILPSICDTVPYIIKGSFQMIKLYGWLPVAAPRDNLSQVLFAIGATIKSDLDGVLRIEGLWDGLSGAVPMDRMYTGGSIDYGAPVTQVLVTEHQYVQGAESQQLFEGTTQQGDIITFNEPMHSLSASGFTILEYGDNYAKLSAGSGTLTGKKYIHNTRQIKKAVSKAQKPNIKTVKDATLVSLVNSEAVAQRLANFYQWQETINASVVYHGEKPGDRLAIYHPYDKGNTAACLQSVDITMSNTLKAQEKSLVGFTPLQIKETEFYDEVEILTQSGVWTVPENVTSVRAVIIQGGQGGWSGESGKEARQDFYLAENTITAVSGWTTYENGGFSGYGSEGGRGGQGGLGGKVLIVTLSVTPGQKISAVIGEGGAGGKFSKDGTVAGTEGTHSIFGEHSSANGAIVPGGYVDIVTEEAFAVSGADGISGGSGSGRTDSSDISDFHTIKEGAQVIGPDGQVYAPGISSEEVAELEKSATDTGTASAFAYGGCGGGAAVGANGKPGILSGQTINVIAYRSGQNTSWPNGYLYAYARAGLGTDGATAAIKGANGKVIGIGGGGGHGGGGCGGFGRTAAITRKRNSATPTLLRSVVKPSAFAAPGNGSDGGKGGPGGIILYYSKPKKVQSGPIVTADGRLFLGKPGRRIVV